MKRKLIPILSAGIFLAFLLCGCQNSFMGKGGAGANVTITVQTADAARTLRPSGISGAALFSRIDLELTKDGALQTESLSSGQTNTSIHLETGTWDINAIGYLEYNGDLYEAARGSSSVNVTALGGNANIVLKTGIFEGAPGMFSYDVNFGGLTITEATLDIGPLNDLHGYATVNTGKKVDLTSTASGTFDLLPGYYLVTMSAKTNDGKIAIWNDLAHIYSGQKTDTAHSFAAGDFSNAVTVAGTVVAGELNGEYVQSVVVIAYSDTNYFNRVANSVPVPLSNGGTGAIYTGDWSIVVPESFGGKSLYVRLEETIGGSGETQTFIRNCGEIAVPLGGDTDVELWASYSCGTWASIGNGITSEDAISHTIQSDGTIKVTTTEKINNPWDKWRLGLWYNYPAENDYRYVYEFEAWTESGESEIIFLYIDHGGVEQEWKTIDINDERQTFTVVSTTRIDPNVDRTVGFQFASDDFTGTFYIKIKSIKDARNYTPSETVEGEDRFTATPVAGGILLKANLKDLPDNINTIVFNNETNGGNFNAVIGDSNNRPDTFEVLYPYVDTGKEYTFALNWWGVNIGALVQTVTAIGGRGELVFSNAEDLTLVQDGNMLKFNIPPVLSSNGDTASREHARYTYEFATGTSWYDVVAEWRYATDKENPDEIDLLDTDNLPSWYYPKDFSAVAGKTCFAGSFYTFDYTDPDIYPNYASDGITGNFRTGTISSVPFTYPNVLPNVITAEPCTEGIKFIIDMDMLPETLSQVSFKFLNAHIPSFNFQPGNLNEWRDNHPGQQFVEIIYPFVDSGKTYYFNIELQGANLNADVNPVTATAGDGEVTITNASQIGLFYDSSTKTMSSNETPQLSRNISSPNTKEAYWEWAFCKGINWLDPDYAWIGPYRDDDPIDSLVLDENLTLAYGDKSRLSDSYAFVLYRFEFFLNEYDNIEFTLDVATSPPFMCPHFEPEGHTDVDIAIKLTENINVNYSPIINHGDDFGAFVSYSAYDAYVWYIDGVPQIDCNNYYLTFSTSELDPGMHYGLVVVSKNSRFYSKEFAFRVLDN